MLDPGIFLAFWSVVVVASSSLILVAVSGVTNIPAIKVLSRRLLKFGIAFVWVLPVAYLVIGAFSWLLDGYWVPFNLCAEAGIFCETRKAVGLDRLLRVIADAPFVVLMMFSLLVYGLLLHVAKDTDEIDKLDHELERLKKQGRL